MSTTDPAPQGPGSVRLDAWLWSVRLFKTRSAATAACRAGHVRINDETVKASSPVRVRRRMPSGPWSRQRSRVLRTHRR